MADLSGVVSLLMKEGEQSLLQGNLDKANWSFNTVIFLDPKQTPHLWQRGLSLYYSSHYKEGMLQFQQNMDVNGSDIEEVLWHFICKAKILGYNKACEDGFLSLHQSETPPPLPMSEVLALFQGNGTVDDVIAAASSSSAGEIVHSYNNTDALGYAHFYIGLYYELQGSIELAGRHLKQAAEIRNTDYMGQLMVMHFELFQRTILRNSLVPLITISSDGTKLSNTHSAIILGGWQLCHGHNTSNNENLTHSEMISKLLEAIDNGITGFDCGDIYTGVEEIYGQLLKAFLMKRGRREDIAINSKLVPDLNVIKEGEVNESYVRGVILRSLNRLRTCYIDLIQFHWWDNSCPGYIETAQLLVSLKNEGLVKQIGVTNFGVKNTLELLQAGIPIASTQIQYSLLDDRPLQSGLVSLCIKHNITILAYGVLAGGFLSDHWIGQPKPTKFDNRSLIKYRLIINEFGDWDLFQELLAVLCLIGDRHSPLTITLPTTEVVCVDHVTVSMVAIAYILNQPGVGGVVLGSLNTSHIKESILSSHLKLTEQDFKDINEVLKKRRGPNGEVYELERKQEGPHGQIMKYNLSQLNEPSHFEELCIRFLELYFSANPVEATCKGYMLTSLNPKQYSLTSECYVKYAMQAMSYDFVLNLTSKDEIEAYLCNLRLFLLEIEGVNKSRLSPDQNVDLEIIIAQINLECMKWLDVKLHERDPAIYLPFDAINYLLPSWGPQEDKHDLTHKQPDNQTFLNQLFHPGVVSLPIEHRLLALLSRLRGIPKSLKDGLENLINPVKIFTERAIKLCNSFEVFLEKDLLVLVEKMVVCLAHQTQQASRLTEEIILAAKIAAVSVSIFKMSLINDVLPNSTNTPLAVGRPVYDKLLHYGHFISDSSALLELGETHFAQVKKQLEKIANEIDPNKTWLEITEELIRPVHPTTDELLTAYLKEISRAKEHMIKYDLVPSLPEGENIQGFYTPDFLVPFSPFGDFLNPAPFACKSSIIDDTSPFTGYLMLHSVAAKSLVPAKEEALLRAHDFTWISVIAPHECYPGHHVQALLAQQHPRVLRKVYESAFFYEGWGLYCEELAYETGFFHKEIDMMSGQESEDGQNNAKNKVYLSGDKQPSTKVIPASLYSRLSRLTQLRLQLWRAARVILDIKFHRGEMTFEECEAFLCHEVMFSPHASQGEVFMYASRPTYATCYIAGYVELMKLRDSERKRCECEGTMFSLKEFHTKLLQLGCLPFPLIKQLFKVSKDRILQ